MTWSSTRFSKKMKRNISLGVVEALICLQSAYEFGRREMGLNRPGP